MSTALPAPAAVRSQLPGSPPGYWSLFRNAALALFAGAVLLWLIVIGLSLLSLVRIDGSGDLAFEPWVVDGPWSLLAAIGWGTLLGALVGGLVRQRVLLATGVRVSRVLTMASVAIAGYGPWIVTSSNTGRIVLALVATPALLRAAAFDSSGRARVLPRAVELTGRRLAFLLLCCAAALVAPFALLHPLSVMSGTNPRAANVTDAGSGWLVITRPGRHISTAVGLTSGRFAITVTAATPLSNSGSVRVVRGPLAVDFPPPGAPNAPLPIHVGAGHTLWVDYAAVLTRCPPSRTAGVTRIRVSYRELGLSLTQTVPLAGSNTLLSCGP